MGILYRYCMEWVQKSERKAALNLTGWSCKIAALGTLLPLDWISSNTPAYIPQHFNIAYDTAQMSQPERSKIDSTITRRTGWFKSRKITYPNLESKTSMHTHLRQKTMHKQINLKQAQTIPGPVLRKKKAMYLKGLVGIMLLSSRHRNKRCHI